MAQQIVQNNDSGVVARAKINNNFTELYAGGGGGGGMTIGGAIAGSTTGSVLFVGAGGVLDQDNPEFIWRSAYKTLVGGSNITFSGSGATPAGGGNTVIFGQDISVTNDHSWSAIFGSSNTLSSNFNDGLMAGTGHTISRLSAANAILGSSNILSNVADTWTIGNLITGQSNSIETTATGIGGSSSFNFIFGEGNKLTGSQVSNSFAGGSLVDLSGLNTFGFGYAISGQTTRPIIASGIHAINMSANSSSQGSGEGARANYSAIIAGQDHDIPSTSPGSVILGGNGIKARASAPNEVYVPSLNIVSANTSGSALFVGTDGQVAQDNTNFFWDNSNNRLGIGTNTPSTTLHVQGNSTFNGATTLTGFTQDNVLFVGASGLITESANFKYSSSNGITASGSGSSTIGVPSGGVAFRVGNTSLGRYITFANDNSTNLFDASAQQVGFISTNGAARMQIQTNTAINGSARVNGTLFVMSSMTNGQAITTNTQVDIRGSGTTASTFTFRAADSGNNSVLRLDDAARLIFGQNSGVFPYISPTSNGTTVSNGSSSANLLLSNSGGLPTDGVPAISFAQNQAVTATSGSRILLGTLPAGLSFAPTSGTAPFTYFIAAPTLNTTGTYSGTARGFYWNPTLTSTTGLTHNAWESTSGNIVTGGGGRFLISSDQANTTTPSVQISNTANDVRVALRLTNSNAGGSAITKMVFTNNSADDGEIFLRSTGSDRSFNIQALNGPLLLQPTASTGVVIGDTAPVSGIRLSVKGSGTTTATGAFYAKNNSDQRTLAVNDVGTVFIGHTPNVSLTRATNALASNSPTATNFWYTNDATLTAADDALHNLGRSTQLTSTVAGTQAIVRSLLTFSPTSGSTTLASFRSSPAYNQTGTASGDVIGFLHDPIVTAVLGEHYAFKSNSGVIGVTNSTAPSASLTDGFKMYSNDIAAGNAAAHFRTENGQVIKLYQSNAGSAYSITNGATDRTYDANATTLDEIADVLYTLIEDLKATGLIA